MALYKVEHRISDGSIESTISVKIVETNDVTKIKSYIKENYPRLTLEMEDGYSGQGGYEYVHIVPFKVDLKL